MPGEMPDITNIMRLTTGYWASATLLAASELNLFGALSQDAGTSEAVASRLNADPRAVAMLLDACAALGLLTKETQGENVYYANTPSSAFFLVPESPGYMGGALRWAADQYAAWGNLAQSVRTGQPAVSPDLHLGADAEQTRAFVLGMHQRALGMARGVIHFVDMSGVTDVLDVGGGSGAFSCLLAQKYPTLQSTVLDLSSIVAISEDLIAQLGVSDRVKTRAGDAVTEDYGTEAYDAILFSGVLHQMSPATIQSMLAKARKALRPQGKLFICDLMTDAAGTHAPAAHLFSLQMLLTSEEGAVFAAESCVQWLENAGFESITSKPLPPPLPYVLVQALRG